MQYKKRGDAIRFERDKQLDIISSSLRQDIQKIPKNMLDRVLNSSAYQLGSMLNKQQVTSIILVKIFTYRAATIGKDLGAITEDNFKQALTIAQQCDNQRKTKGWKNAIIDSNNQNEFSPLFGVPISIKDAFNIKGLATTIGIVEKHKHKCQKDGEIIQVLKLAGTIPFVKTNLPQLGMTYESSNRIFGDVKNPWNQNKTAGGSTGGEASLLASRSSPIGIGSDIGGSLRNPAEFCGICSLKPNSSRFMTSGHFQFAPSISGQNIIKLALGPMSRHVDDLACFMKIVLDQKFNPKDIAYPYKKLIPFDSKQYKTISENPQKLRIGYFDSLQIFPSSKACRRAVQQVVQILKQQGHAIIPVKIPKIPQIIQIMIKCVVGEGGLKGYHEMLQGEPIHQTYDLMNLSSKFPKFFNWILSKTLSIFKPRMGMMISHAKEISAYQYLIVGDKCNKAKAAFTEMWQQDKLDFIVCPGFALQAPTIGSTNQLGSLPALYNFMFNVLDVPVGSLPITICKQNQAVYQSSYNDPFNTTAQRIQKDAQGLPVGIQVVGMPFQQQRVLGLMKNIQSSVKFSQKHPYPF